MRTELFIKDNGFGAGKIKVGEVSNSNSFSEHDIPLRAVWSKDGTLIALVAWTKFGENIEMPGYGFKWSHGYDFSQHKMLGTREELSASPETSIQISKILAERGGEGIVLIPAGDNSNAYRRPVWPWDGFH